MPCLVELLDLYGIALVADAASTTPFVMLLRCGQPPVWRRSTAEAGKALFLETESCLSAAGIRFDEIGAFVFCEGPGSMLGIRTVAVAIRAWQELRPRPIFSYRSLTLLGQVLGAKISDSFGVICDARRESWHLASVECGAVAPLRRISNEELKDSPLPLHQAVGFRSWQSAPRATTPCIYDVPALFAGAAEHDLFSEVSQPDAYKIELPNYKKWSAQVHSATVATTQPMSI